MNPSNTQTPNASATWGKPMSVVAFRATAVAIAIAGLAQPAASHAEKVWDIGAFDSCVAAANDRYLSGKTDNDTWGDEIRFCCERSGPGSVRAPVPSTSTPLTAVSTGLLEASRAGRRSGGEVRERFRPRAGN